MLLSTCPVPTYRGGGGLHFLSQKCPFQRFLGTCMGFNMGQRWLKIALNHLFEHPKWSGNNFGKNHFSTTIGPTDDPRNPTLVRALCLLHHSVVPIRP